MDQRSDNIRQDIESTRAALDEKLDSLENKTREIFDLKHQVAERPWTALGLAVAAGYVLGNMGGDDSPSYDSGSYQVDTTNYTPKYTSAGIANYVSNRGSSSTPHTPSASSYRPSEHRSSSASGFFAQFDDEIAMLKQAALTTLREFLHDSIREYAPAVSKHVDRLRGEQAPDRVTSSASQPSGPPTSPDRSYVKTYHPPSETETERERSIGATADKF